MATITVGTSAVELTGWTSKQRLIIQNLGSAAIYYGRTDAVTTANGVRIDASGHLLFDSPMSVIGNIWLISGSAGQDVRWEVIG